MASPSFDDLTSLPSQDEVLANEVLPELQARGVKVTDWITGGVLRSMAYVVAKLRATERIAVAAMCAAGWEDFAFGFSAAPNGMDVTGWAPLIAKQRYNVDRIEATYTKRNITLTNSTITAYGPLAAGAIMVAFPSGRRYISNETATIIASDATVVEFRSEFPFDSASGLAYNTDASGSTLGLITSSFPGVTATNPAPDYTSPVVQIGSGLGTLTLGTLPPSGPVDPDHSVVVTITGGGNRHTATWTTSLDGNAPEDQGAAGEVLDLDSTGIDIYLDNNGGSPAFVAGTKYYFQTPGTDITEAGRDAETPQELGTRCHGLWPSLAFPQDEQGNWIPTSPTMSAYEALTRSISSQIKVCLVETSATVNNQVDITISGDGSVVPTSVVAIVNAFYTSKSMMTDSVVVYSPDLRTVTLAGCTISVKAALMATAQASLTTSLSAYMSGVDASNLLPINGLIDRGYLNGLIRFTPGVTHIDDGLTLTTSAGTVVTDVQLPITPGAKELATLGTGFDSRTAFSWVAV